MWNRDKYDKEILQRMTPTSKAALKIQCLQAAKFDVTEAERLYNFMIKDMEELPLFEPQKPSVIMQAKDTVVDAFKWANDNQEQIFNWVGFIKSLFNKGGGMPPAAGGAAVPNIN
jgi:hypothetical protein